MGPLIRLPLRIHTCPPCRAAARQFVPILCPAGPDGHEQLMPSEPEPSQVPLARHGTDSGGQGSVTFHPVAGRKSVQSLPDLNDYLAQGALVCPRRDWWCGTAAVPVELAIRSETETHSRAPL